MSSNGHKNTEAQDALALLDTFGSGVNFDEVIPEPVQVSIMEFTPQQVGFNEHHEPVMRNTLQKRIALINTYVPMRILHRMMATQERMKIAQAKNPDQQDQQAIIQWISEQVLEVWKLTEPDMTYDRLTTGLVFQQIVGLFNRFFASQLKALGQQKLNNA